MSNSIFCQDCGKVLLQQKGEYDHGCLDCAVSIQGRKLFWLRKENKRLREVLEMVEDNSKMHRPDADPYTRLYCLAERAREVLNKEKE